MAQDADQAKPPSQCPCGCGAYAMPGATVICSALYMRCMRRLSLKTMNVWAHGTKSSKQWQNAWARILAVAKDKRGRARA